ncbi:MAG: carboxypeptidase regulatory-like domain-containing protein [Gammaproteobacteria bacterium]|nr:carboxypeptidase regulatory-like domain-containing protein [Gammaproteobacteria bacterium]MDH3449653.1 carboxypeptidase regulatory-like domain-containing protein [Gammaproteobacteria bacterium]
MKSQRLLTLIAGCLFVFAAGPAAAAKYKVVSVTDGGSISGRVTLNGPAPAPEILKVDEDVEACGGDRPSDELLVSGGGGIQNVVVRIENIDSGKDWDMPATEFTYDQKKCSFTPRVIVIRPNMAGAVLNSDGVGHNFHTISKGVFNINKKIQPGSSLAVSDKKIRKSGLVNTKCDIHSWMGGAWWVAENPYTVLSDADGNFTMSNVPPGKYKIAIWHEKLGESTQEVEVGAGADTKLDIVLKP